MIEAIIRSQRSAYNEAQTAKRAAEAIEVRVLHAAYLVAEARAEEDSTPGIDGASRDQILAWHLRAIVGEFAVENRKSDASLVSRARQANTLMTSYRTWVDELEAGRIEYAHTTGLLRQTDLLTDEQQNEFGESLLDFALKHTSSQTNRFAEREAARLAREEFERAHERARATRRVTVRHEPAGMSTIFATVPTELAVPIDDLLTRQARELRNENKAEIEEYKLLARSASATDRARAEAFEPDERTIEQIRADLFCDVLLTSTPQAILESTVAGAPRIKATVNITVPVLSLLDADVAAQVDGLRADEQITTVLNGLHPMSVSQARQFASQQPALQRVLTDPIRGHVVTVDTYEPSPSLRAFLRVRDETCRFPGCSRAAASCDCDHTIAHAEGGPTAEWNLGHLCRAHHVQKHHRGWKLEQQPGGVLIWTSPTGQRITTEPKPPGPIFRLTEPSAQPGPGPGPGPGPEPEPEPEPGPEASSEPKPDRRVIPEEPPPF